MSERLYANTPAVALSQPDASHIALAAVAVTFGSHTVTYNARTIPIDDPGDIPTWLYVTIADPDYLGDAGTSTELDAFAEPNHSKCGEPGYIYMGAIRVGGPGKPLPPCPGGWPAPQLIFAEVL
jgi:hypothetical protein